MQNPFESGQIKNYILLYVSVVVIMVLFFIATTLFNEPKKIEKKEFNTTIPTKIQELKTKEESPAPARKFKLLQESY